MSIDRSQRSGLRREHFIFKRLRDSVTIYEEAGHLMCLGEGSTLIGA
jgi:hypothetical protein